VQPQSRATAIGQCPDGVGLIHDHQHPAVLLQTEEKLAQPRLILRQRLIEDPFSLGVQCGSVMLGFADIESAVDLVSLVHPALLCTTIWPQSRHPMLAPTLQRDLAPVEGAGRVPISSQRVSPNPATTPPGSSMTGQESHTGSSDQSPTFED
jgi:hypothetical protein